MEQQIKGSLYGLVWGDALGCPVETYKSHEIKKIYGLYEQLPEEYPVSAIHALNPKRVKRLRPLGLHSDDTQQALGLLAIGLTAWRLNEWRTMLVEGMKKGTWRGYGANFSQAVDKLKRGTRPELSGSSSAGMGAAMRVGPLGALYRDDLSQLKKVIIESTAVTHGDSRAIAIAFATAYAVYGFVNGMTRRDIMVQLPLEVKDVEDQICTTYASWSIDRTQPYVVSEGIARFFAEDPHDLQVGRQLISQIAEPLLADGFTKAHPNQGFCLLGGLHALFIGLKEEVSPNEALFELCQLGYDTDTVAAIAGSILGARFGTDWIPMEKLYDRERIELYGEALVNRSGSPEKMATFLTKEAQLTKEEKGFQRTL